MRRDKKRAQGSLYFLLIRYFAALVCVTILLATLLLTLEAVAYQRLAKMPKTEQIITHEELLTDEKYAQLSKRLFLEENSYIEVVDENGTVLYCDREGITNSYTKEELSYILELFADTYLSVEQVKAANGQNQTVVVKYNYDSKYGEESTVAGVLVLDENRNVLYTTMDFTDDQLTEKELNYWYGQVDDEYGIQKYQFATKNGETRYLLLHTYMVLDKGYYMLNEISKVTLPAFVVLFVLLLLFFVFLINRKVKVPLQMLNEAMKGFTGGDREGEIDYRGPRELVQICDSFNELSGQLKESERRQKKLSDEKQKMLADISHDLKTPITVIQGYSKAICDGVIPEGNRKKYLTTIYQKSNALAELINSFYEYSRLEHPQFLLVKESGDICEYFREYLAVKYEELSLSGFELELELPEDVIGMEFDHLQLKRVFENLIANSMKHNSAGTMIFALLREEESSIVIELGDNGSGIPKELGAHIFEPFVVGDESRNSKQGTGLGLAISKKIVEAHGGTIELLEAAGHSMVTMFKIRLPRPQ